MQTPSPPINRWRHESMISLRIPQNTSHNPGNQRNNRSKAMNIVNKHLNKKNQPQEHEEDEDSTPNFFQAIEMMQTMTELFKQLPGLLKNLNKIKSAKGKQNKTYALIEALLDCESDYQ
ncbi:hypothetical protein NPIL_142701 [Nephila pilipes]|uniref:Uncharacterized protein n=1 Tax=Nephila pilipes TaxID=299642 RepID=A0A8X6PT73_NEPPI|nr:hypothetical protein NPIL_142701 [Nephila pilipes]